MLWADALGLGLFSASGVGLACKVGQPALAVGIVVTAGLRLLALARGWRVPGWAER